MNDTVRDSIWRQFGAAIDTLDDAIRLCPDSLWTLALWKDPEDAAFGQFWFLAYHTLRWLDVFLAGTQEGFVPPSPFLVGRLPETPYSKDDVLAYLAVCRKKCRSMLETLNEERANQRCVFEWMEPNYLELQLYSMRHVQEHAAQLSLALGQQGVEGFDWIPKARE